MGTKLKPCPYDCYHNALPDEPMFVLLARDPQAPDLVRRWAEDRVRRILVLQCPATDADLAGEAMTCALSMEEWRMANFARWRTEEAPPDINAELLAALKIARGYAEYCLDDARDTPPEPRTERARAEDAITIAELEGHLALIDAAIAKGEPP